MPAAPAPGGEHHHGGAMLVVVEDRDVAALLELFFDLKAPGSGDILEIDPAEAARKQRDGVHNLVHVVAADAERHRIDSAERLEEDAFSFHHRHARLGADIAQAEHRRAVGDDRDGVAASGQLIAFGRILFDFEAGGGDAGGVGEREVVLVGDGQFRHRLELAAQPVVQFQRFLCVIHR